MQFHQLRSSAYSSIQGSAGPAGAVPSVERIARYYQDIDIASLLDDSSAPIRAAAEEAMERVVDIFSPDAIYRRAGRDLVGLFEIERFYRAPYPEGRRGFTGRHCDLQICVLSSRLVLCLGVFVRDDRASFGFADVWEFDTQHDSARAVGRHTLLQYSQAFTERQLVEADSSTLNIASNSSAELFCDGRVPSSCFDFDSICLRETIIGTVQRVVRFRSDGHALLRPSAVSNASA
ncbi:MAG: hypothetical protein K1X79_01790 [Oligoflexia bacterium]|nr:hypothetical protein [Oligoflexia bacterium]